VSPFLRLGRAWEHLVGNGRLALPATVRRAAPSADLTPKARQASHVAWCDQGGPRRCLAKGPLCAPPLPGATRAGAGVPAADAVPACPAVCSCPQASSPLAAPLRLCRIAAPCTPARPQRDSGGLACRDGREKHERVLCRSARAQTRWGDQIEDGESESGVRTGIPALIEGSWKGNGRTGNACAARLSLLSLFLSSSLSHLLWCFSTPLTFPKEICVPARGIARCFSGLRWSYERVPAALCSGCLPVLCHGLLSS
jgi:hypothetical protein